MKKILSQLFEHQKLDRATAKKCLMEIAKGEHNPIHVASFITVYNMRSITVPELEGFRDAMLELCVPIDLEGRETLDIVGTGGDGKNNL